jgi:hypothetical protein
MRIDRDTERLAREVLAGVVSRDPDRVAAGLEALAEEDAVAEAMRLTFAVARSALLRVHDGGLPSERQNRELAGHVAESESWTPVSADEVYDVLEALCDPASRPDLAQESLINTVFVLTGFLLSSYLTALGHSSWTDFLDDVLNALDAAPDT